MLELLDRPCLAGIANSDELRPLQPLETTTPTVYAHLSPRFGYVQVRRNLARPSLPSTAAAELFLLENHRR